MRDAGLLNIPAPRPGFVEDTSPQELQRQAKMMADAYGPSYNRQDRSRQPQRRQHHHQFTDITFRDIRQPVGVPRMTQEQVVKALASELPSTRSAPGGGKLPPATTEPAQRHQQSQHHQMQRSQPTTQQHQQQWVPMQQHSQPGPRILSGGVQEQGKNAKRNKRRTRRQQTQWTQSDPHTHTRGRSRSRDQWQQQPQNPTNNRSRSRDQPQTNTKWHGRSRSHSNVSRNSATTRHSQSASRSRSRSTSIRSIAEHARKDRRDCLKCGIRHAKGEMCPNYICSKCNDIGDHWNDNCPRLPKCRKCGWWTYRQENNGRCPCLTFDKDACLWCGSTECEWGGQGNCDQ